MNRTLRLTFVALAITTGAYADKHDLIEAIDAQADDTWAAALQIWEWAEPGYQEHLSAGLLARMLDDAGFTVERGVANIPTAFVATYGQGSPVIGILGEYDALPGLSQEAKPQRAPIEGQAFGHGCGHHLFGAASASAAIALSKQIRAGEMKGTIRFYGSPAEEGGSGKTFMAQAGHFKRCDAILHWHPGSRNTAGDPTNLARIAVKFRFHGRSAHAAGAPEEGRSSLDAVALTNHAAELMREHTPQGTRIHHVITAGGGAPNVVPDFAEVFFYVRHPSAPTVRKLYDRLLKCAEAGALATETKLEIEFLGGTHNILPNDTLSQVTLKNLAALQNIEYTIEETAFAEELQTFLQSPGKLSSIAEVLDKSGSISMGSTDVGDVSWVTPTTGFSTACWVPGTPAHSWQATAAGGTTIARKGMQLAAKVIAATAWDLAHDPQTLRNAKAELENRRSQYDYKALLEPGQEAPLDYRNNP